MSSSIGLPSAIPTGVCRAAVAGLLVVGIGVAATPAVADTYTVKSANDSGTDTMRWAIGRANGHAGRDDIEFDVGGANPQVIALQTNLPSITGKVTIDGYTQPGAVEAPDSSTPAQPQIVIDAQRVTRGLRLASNGSELRGLVVQGADGGAGAAFLADGIQVDGNDNRITGNFIGTDETGLAAVPNVGDGVQVDGDDNVVGGAAAQDRNVISANPDNVHVYSGAGNEILGNLIGTDANGMVALGGGNGVVFDSSENHVGGPATGAGNVISGNVGAGIELAGDLNSVEGNLVGTNAAGDAALPNGHEGVYVAGDDNAIGGPQDGQRNVVAGNNYAGIRIEAAVGTGDPAEDNRVEGNLIGTDSTGTQSLANLSEGIVIQNSGWNTIGGSQAGAGNVVAGNGDEGVRIQSIIAPANYNRILGNQIGTDVDGTLSLGNGLSGVSIEDGNFTDVGDASDAGANTIAFNGLDGVTVDDGTDNSIMRNSIFSNANLGIDLNRDGETDNDAPADLDADSGANDLQNYPLITSAVTSGGETTIEWTLDSLASTTFHIELYGNLACDEGHDSGEGRTYLGSAEVTTDANGHAAGETVTTTPVIGVVTATARVNVPPDLQSGARVSGKFSTSEFSPCRRAVLVLGPLP